MNLVGEHVDHQGGLVLPLALREGVAVAWGRRPDRAVRILMLDPGSADRFVIGEATRSGKPSADLARGTCAVLAKRLGHLPGLDLAVAADLPARRGLGSSGTFTTAIAKAFLAAVGGALGPGEIAAVAMEVEETWAGVRCGAMDPYVAAVGEPGVPLLLDCRSLTHEALPWPDGVEAVAVDTGVSRRLSETPYGERRAELERGLAAVRARLPATRSLRDLSPGEWASVEGSVPEPERRRCRHVVTEIDRVRRAADALRRGDARAPGAGLGETLGEVLGAILGAIVDESHRSLAADFECSTPAIDALVASVRGEPGVLGARLQGAGWGGSLVAIRRRA